MFNNPYHEINCFLDIMTESNVWLFAVPTQLNGTLDASGVPKSANIYYHENRWWYELKTGQAFTNELHQRESNFNKIRTAHGGLDFASGPFGKNCFFSFVLFF